MLIQFKTLATAPFFVEFLLMFLWLGCSLLNTLLLKSHNIILELFTKLRAIICLNRIKIKTKLLSH